jgi:hypothetical protein
VQDLRSRPSLVAVLLVVSSMLGCTALQGNPRPFQNSGLVATTPGVDFGTVVVGNTAAAVDYLYNAGRYPITITQANISGAGFRISSPGFPVTISPGQRMKLVLGFAPQASGSPSGTVALLASNPEHSTSVSVSGTAIPAGKLAVTPVSMIFGSIEIGKRQAISGAFSNTGATDVTVSQIAANSGDFHISGVTLPLTLSPGQRTSFAVQFAPSVEGTRSASISVTASDSMASPASHSSRYVYIAHASNRTESDRISVVGIGKKKLASGSGTELGQLLASPASLSFGSTQTSSTQQKSVVLTNSGTADISISQIAAGGTGYTVTTPSLPITLAGSQTVTLTVKFAPQAAGAANGSLAIASNASNPSLSVGLSGTGVAPGQLTVSATPLSFGNVQVGASQKTSATVTNSGGASVTLTGASVSGTAFSMSSMSMPVTLGPNQSTTVSVTCAPQASGKLSGNLNITSNAVNSTLAVPLTATAVMPGSLTVTPSTLSFGSVQTGSTQSLAASLNNSGGTSVTISQATFSGTGYSISGLSLPVTIPAGQSASFNVVFAPQTAGTDNFNLSIASDASNPTLTVPLAGTAVTPGSLIASASSLSFGSVQMGDTKTVSETVTNSGGSSVTLSQATAGGGFSVTGLALPATLAPGKSASFNVVFSPQSSGNSNVNLAITSNAPSPTLLVALSGTGSAPGSLTGTAVSFGSVQVGGSGTKSATLTNSGSSTVTVSQANVTGAGYSITGLTTPLTLAAGQNFTFNVIFTPQSTGAISGSIAIVSDATSSPTLTLSGTGTAAGQFSISPGTFSFGSVTVGSSKTLNATLSATGSGVTVTSGSSSSPEFTLTGPNFPIVIPAGGTASCTLTFTPQAGGPAAANVSFLTSASSSPVTEGLSGTGVAAVQHSVTLSWNPSTSTVAGYNVYRSGTMGGPYAKLNASTDSSTNYTDSSVQGGNSYFYVTTATGTDGVESTYSNEVSAAVPTP